MEKNKNALLSGLVIVALFCLIMAITSFRNLRKMEFEFNEKKASLIKEGLDLKDRIESLQEMFKQKTAELASLEEKKLTIENELKQIKSENEKLKRDTVQLEKKYSGLMAEKKAVTAAQESLKKKYISLTRRLQAIENSPVVLKIKKSLENENNSEIKKVLEAAVANIEMIQTGKYVDLTPITIVGKDKNQQQAQAVSPGQKETGQVISLDKKNNLAVIDLGRLDNVKEADICIFLKDDLELARGQVISVRYRIAAVFINEIQFKKAITQIEEGDKVRVEKK